MRVLLHEVQALRAPEVAAIRALSAAVHPPGTTDDWPGRSYEWARPPWCAVCWDDDGRALSHAGVLLRDCLVAGAPALVGGIGGVMTHPAARRRGLAAQAIERAFAFFDERGADFAVLVCEPGLVPLYEKQGWRSYPEPLVVSQRGASVAFTFNMPMVRAVRGPGPADGVIDLLGPPW